MDLFYRVDLSFHSFPDTNSVSCVLKQKDGTELYFYNTSSLNKEWKYAYFLKNVVKLCIIIKKKGRFSDFNKRRSLKYKRCTKRRSKGCWDDYKNAVPEKKSL